MGRIQNNAIVRILVSFIGIVIVMQWLMYKVFLFIGAAFQAIKGFASDIFFNTSTFGMHPSITCITLHLNGYIKVYVYHT